MKEMETTETLSVGAIAEDIRTFIMEELLENADFPGDPIEQGLLDSLALEMLLDHVETTYGLEFTEEEVVAENFTSIDRVAVVVEAKLRAT